MAVFRQDTNFYPSESRFEARYTRNMATLEAYHMIWGRSLSTSLTRARDASNDWFHEWSDSIDCSVNLNSYWFGNRDP